LLSLLLNSSKKLNYLNNILKINSGTLKLNAPLNLSDD
jgi:hypothetical protein